MESLEIISQVVTQIGFPIAMCIILFNSLSTEREYHKESEEKINKSINSLEAVFTQSIHEQQNKMVEAINNNTLVMQRLIDKLSNSNLGE